MKNAIIKSITSLLVSLTILSAMFGSAYIIYHLEDLISQISYYVWTGVGDLIFWTLAILESYIGLLIVFHVIPRKFGCRRYLDVYSESFPRELSRYFMAALIGFLMGLAFSGVWKLIFLAFQIVY